MVSKGKTRHYFIYVFMIVVLVNAMVSLFSVWSHHAARRLTYQLSRVQGELYQAKLDENRLRLEVAHLTSPQRVEFLSKELMNSVPID